MLKKFCLSLSLFIVAAITTCSGQDSLQQWLATTKGNLPDAQKLTAYKSIFASYQFTKPDTAVYYATTSLQYFTARKYQPGIASMTALLGEIDNARGRVAQACKEYEIALGIYTQLNDRKGIGAIHNALGVVDGRTGNLQGATQHFMIALKEFEQQNDTHGLVNTYMKLGVVNEKSNELDKALGYYNKAIALLQAHPQKGAQLVNLYNNVGIVYGRKGDIDKAKQYFEQALAMSAEPAMFEVKVLSLTNLGIVYGKLGDNKSAMVYFNDAISLAKEKDMPENFVRLSINLAALQEDTDPDKALATLTDGLQVAMRAGQRPLLAELYEAMVDVYTIKKDFKTALELSKKQKNLEDTLFNLDKAREIANMQSVYELEQSNARVQLLEQASRRNTMKRNIIITITVVLAVILILLIWFFIKSRRLNATLIAREAELQRTNEVKDKIFSIIGHDLRGPIGNIPAMLELLYDDSCTDDETKMLLETLTEHSKASKETLEKLLYWGQAQIKGLGINRVKFNTHDYISNNLKLVKSSAEQKHISIINTIPAGLQVFADVAHFDFIFRNLLSNAIKFTYTNGSVHMSADSNTKPGFVVFAVRDTGTGIDKDKMQHIFKPLGNSTLGTANEKGTSIGLMLCSEFVTENGGTIWAESEPGKGSVFYFSLPVG